MIEKKIYRTAHIYITAFHAHFVRRECRVRRAPNDGNAQNVAQPKLRSATLKVFMIVCGWQGAAGMGKFKFRSAK